LQCKRKPPKLHENASILLATRSGLKARTFLQARGKQPFQLPAALQYRFGRFISTWAWVDLKASHGIV